ncbi:MAG: coproporphyrinogen dehydrogenase HemZ [Deltaproteobacteria bacterium]
MIYLDLNQPWLYDAVHELVRMAFPGEDITRQADSRAEIVVVISCELSGGQAGAEMIVTSKLGTTRAARVFDITGSERDRVRQVKQGVRYLCYGLLCDHTSRNINAYGILTGMRPVKLVQRMLDRGMDESVVIKTLKGDHLMRENKARLLLEVAVNNRPFLPEHQLSSRTIGLYIGIPFCASRCIYCSFPGAVLRGRPGEMDEFLKVLEYEIETVGTCLEELGYRVQSIYLGGGTPAVLSVDQTDRLFELLAKQFISPTTAEITVEAGRPDALSREKLHAYYRHGVDRICINPQTMVDSTLKRIGRNHDREGVLRAVDWVRDSGIKQINMDLIVGLPGEGIRENTHTAEEILKLNPENITVHTLALKRGSLLFDSHSALAVQARVEEAEQGVELFAGILRGAGYQPYYLYRQKYMQASMENIGHALPGQYCLYNIQMIEERQTVLGLGGGGASKFVDPQDWNLTSLYNPRDPVSYCRTIDILIRRKVDKLRALN